MLRAAGLGALLTLSVATLGCQGATPGSGDEATTASAPMTTALTTAPTPEAEHASTSSPPSGPQPGPSTVPTGASAFRFDASTLDADQRRRMTGVSWRPGCPVGLDALRLVVVRHWGFDGQAHDGQLIVHADAVPAMETAFSKLFEAGFRIRQIRPIDEFGGDDTASIEADNTSAFNCRPVTGSANTWSQHAYGRAIDVNPLENPYVSHGRTSHEGSKPYLDRSQVKPGMILPSSAATAAFAAAGWKWGGDWDQPKDLQHFSANGR